MSATNKGLRNSRRTSPWARRAKGRGVSPIIATILLVAITVVLAAVLYVLISGLTGGGTSSPYSLQMSNKGQSTPVAGTDYITLAVNPTSGLTTGLFGLKITNVVHTGITAGTVTAACVQYAALTGANCAAPAANTWYAVLVFSNSTVASAWGSTSTWSGGTVALNAGMTLVIVTSSTTSFSGIGDTLSAFGTSSSSVSGSVTL
jgi:flagellin-like protein